MDADVYAREAIANIIKEAGSLEKVRVKVTVPLSNIFLPEGNYTLSSKYSYDFYNSAYLESPIYPINHYNMGLWLFGELLLNGALQLFVISDSELEEETKKAKELKNFSFSSFIEANNVSIYDFVFRWRDADDRRIFIVTSTAPNFDVSCKKGTSGIVNVKDVNNLVYAYNIRDLEELIKEGSIEFRIKNK